MTTLPTRPVTAEEALRDRRRGARQDVPAVHRRRVGRLRLRRDDRGREPGGRAGHRARPGVGRRGRRPGGERRRAAFESWGKTTPQERSLALLKLADAIEARADELGRPRVEERRQAGRRGDRRDPGHGRQPAVLRGRRAPARGQGRERVHGRPHLVHPPRTGGRGRVDRAVELPDHDGRLEDRAGARGGQHGHPQALDPDAADALRSPRSRPRSCLRACST